MASGKDIVRITLEADKELRNDCLINGSVPLYHELDFKSWDYSLPTLSHINCEGLGLYRNFKKMLYDKYESLQYLDWNNIAIAGGCISTILLNKEVNDIDFFIYGLSKHKANKKVEYLTYFLVSRSTYNIYKRTKNCLTIETDYGTFQIIYRLYRSISEILYGFDLGSSAVAFNGLFLEFSTMGRFAFQYGANIIDTTRRSKSYEHRLDKYLKRGFKIIMPNFDTDKITNNMITFKNMTIYLKHTCENNLIVENIDHFTNNVCDYEVDNQYISFHNNIYNYMHQHYDRITLIYDNRDVDILFDEICLGGGYNYEYKHLVREIHRGAFPDDKIKKMIITHTPEEIFEIRNYINKVQTIIDINFMYLMRNIKRCQKAFGWITENAGTQLTSSFNPIDEPPEKWYGQYYMNL